MVLSDGIIGIYNEEWIISNLTAQSEWLSGRIDGTLNLNEYNKTSGSIIIDKFTFYTEDNIPVSVHDLSLVLKKNNDIPDSYGDNSKIKKDTGWNPRLSVYKALKKLLDINC